MPTTKKSLLSQALITALLALVLVAADFFFFGRQFEGRYPRRWTAFPETFGLLLLFSFAFRRSVVLFVCFFLAFMAFIQMCHLSYFGTLIHPTKIYLAFREVNEVAETLHVSWKMMTVPILILAGTCLLIFLSTKCFPQREFINFRPLKWLILIALIYPPLRTFATGNTYGKQPAIGNLAFSNMYASFSYFLGKTLVYKLHRHPTATYKTNLRIERRNPRINVVFILGESLRYQNMQLFGYDKETTPELVRLSHEAPMVYRKAISGGVSTDVAVPLLLNDVQGPDPLPVILSQEQCLFRLAKKNGFTTHFYSAQSAEDLKHILNYMCPTYADELITGKGVSLTEDKETRYYDDQLLSFMDRIPADQPSFIMFHQRGSHSPYEYRYPPEEAAFPIDPNADWQRQKVAHYDNSVAYTSQILSEMIHRLIKRSSLPTYIVFTSDHGQILGENKAWGHLEVSEQAFQVPFFLVAPSGDPVLARVKEWPDYISHGDISDLLVNLLGYDRPIRVDDRREVYVSGSDIDGLDGGSWLQLGQAGVLSIKPVQ